MSDAAEASAVPQRNSQLQESLSFPEIVSGGRFRPGSAEPENPNSGSPIRPESMANLSQANAANLDALIAPGAQSAETAKIKDSVIGTVLQEGIDTGDTEQIGKAVLMTGSTPEYLERFAKNLEEKLQKENPDARVQVVDGKVVIYNSTSTTALEIDPATGKSVTRPVNSDQSGNAVVDHSKSVLVPANQTFADIMARSPLEQLIRRGGKF